MMDSDNHLDLLPWRRPRRSCARRLELRIEGILYHLHDLSGRRFNAKYLRKSVLRPDYFIRRGASGPELVFLLDQSLCGLRGESAGSHDPIPDHGINPHRSGHEAESERAAGGQDHERAPQIRKGREIRRFWNRSRVATGILVCVLAAVLSYGSWGKTNLTQVKSGEPTFQLETKRAAGGDEYLQISLLIDRLFNRQTAIPDFEPYKQEENFVKQELNALMKEFGAEEYSVPPEFVKEVDRFVRQYQERDHDLMAKVLAGERKKLEQVRDILRRNHLPEDLAYMALVESGFLPSCSSREGAAGFWQFTEVTAREYGMKVNESVDERLDLAKSTQAASRYIRDLVLDFGTGSSVMLAMAAYNSGREAVRRAVRNVKDPIKQRNFWYLYCTRALPEETCEYVPKVFAAIIVGRNPRRFGF
ncbi:MAG: lytic transglycosylase domain-containing protein [Acidobacteriota bacterium]